MSRPYKIVYGIRKTGLTDEDGQERFEWTPIGVAFPNQKDNSFNLILHYLPTDLTTTRIHIRDPRPREEQPGHREETKPQPPPQRQQPPPQQARAQRDRQMPRRS